MCKCQGCVIFVKRDIQPRGIFMPLIFFKKNLYLQVCKFEKKYFRLEFFFWRIPSPRILRQVGHVQIEGRGICFKRDIQPRGISAKVPKRFVGC